MPTLRLKFANSKPMNGLILTGSVGEHGTNKPHDTALIQVLLKTARAQGALDPLYTGKIDGQSGPKTIAAIRRYKNPENRQNLVGRSGLLDLGSHEVRELARHHRQHVLVMEGTATPYVAPRVTEATLKARIAKLDWLEPGFRDDLAEFAHQVTRETGMIITFRPLSGTPQPQCETRAEMVVVELNWIRPDGGVQQVMLNGLAHYPAGQALIRALHEFTGQFTQTLQADASPLRLILSQSAARYQQRLRDNPRLASVWVENPMKRRKSVV